MDMCMIDVTDIQNVKIGDEVILIGGDEGNRMVEDVASLMGTISYEILTSFGRRVRREYNEDNLQIIHTFDDRNKSIKSCPT